MDTGTIRFAGGTIQPHAIMVRAPTPAAAISSCVDRAASLAAQVMELRDALLGPRSEEGNTDGAPIPQGALNFQADRARYVEGKIDEARKAVSEIERAMGLNNERPCPS